MPGSARALFPSGPDYPFWCRTGPPVRAAVAGTRRVMPVVHATRTKAGVCVPCHRLPPDLPPVDLGRIQEGEDGAASAAAEMGTGRALRPAARSPGAHTGQGSTSGSRSAARAASRSMSAAAGYGRGRNRRGGGSLVVLRCVRKRDHGRGPVFAPRPQPLDRRLAPGRANSPERHPGRWAHGRTGCRRLPRSCGRPVPRPRGTGRA